MLEIEKKVDYNSSLLPVYIDKIDLSNVLFHTDLHTHMDIELIYILKGSIDYTIEDQTITLIKENGLFINSGRLHHGFSNANWNCEYIKININPSILTRIDSKYKESYQSLFYDYDDYIVLNRFNHRMLLQAILDLYDIREMNDQLMLASKVFELFSLIKQELNQPRTVYDKSNMDIFKRILAYVYEHYKSNLTIDIVSSEFHITRNRLCTLFNQYAGTTFANYLTLYRLNMAIALLKNDQLSVTEVAEACGFSSPSYFSVNFKQYTGKTPKQFQLEHKKTDL